MLLPALASALALASAALPAIASLRRAPAPLPAFNDPFYADPGNLTMYTPGDVVRTRSVQTAEVIPFLSRVQQVVYRTTNAQSQPSWSVASIFTPNVGDSSKLFSIQLPEDSANLNCAPSQWVIKGKGAAFAYGMDTNAYLNWALQNGWVTVIPDHEGPNSGFLSGLEEGRAVLDAIRATRNAVNLPRDIPVGLYGYSGGAHATAWAVNLGASYASDVNIKGASYGGTPVDPASIAQSVDGTSQSGLLPSAFAGVMNTQPESFKDMVLGFCSPAFASAIQAATQQCGLTVLGEYANMSIAKLCNETMGEKLWQPSRTPFWSLLANESLLTNVSSARIANPNYPLLLQHGGADNTIPPGQAEAYVEQQCAAGAKVQWVSWPGQDHIPTIPASMPATMQFFVQLFNGNLPTVACGQRRDDLLTLGSPDLAATLGTPVALALQALAATMPSPLPTPAPNSDNGISPTSSSPSPSGTAKPHPNSAGFLRLPNQWWLACLSSAALIWALSA